MSSVSLGSFLIERVVEWNDSICCQIARVVGRIILFFMLYSMLYEYNCAKYCVVQQNNRLLCCTT